MILTGDDGSEITRFNFFEAWPCRWRLLPLDGESGTTRVEELEIALERIEKGSTRAFTVAVGRAPSRLHRPLAAGADSLHHAPRHTPTFRG